MRQNHHLLVSRKLLDTLTLSALLITVFGNWLICQVWSVQITPSKWANIFISRLSLKVLRQSQNEADICRRRKYRAFPFTWPTCMQFFCNKSKCLHKRSVEISQDWFSSSTWPQCHCFGTPRWLPWRGLLRIGKPLKISLKTEKPHSNHSKPTH